MIRPTMTTAPSAASPATTCRTRSPRCARRPVKGRRAVLAVASKVLISIRDYWIVLILFWAALTTSLGSGAKILLRMEACCLAAIAQLKKGLSTEAFGELFGTIAYVKVAITHALRNFFDFGGLVIEIPLSAGTFFRT